MVVDCLKRLAEYRGVAPRGEGEKSMNKGQMADRLAARTGLNEAAARDAVDGVFETIGEALANGEEVRIAGFGSFGTRSRPARTVPAAIQGPASPFRYWRRSLRPSRLVRRSRIR